MENDLIAFCRRFGFLLQNKIPLMKALEISLEEEDGEFMQFIISQILKNICTNGSFAESMHQACDRFSATFLGLIRAAEQNGDLDISMENIANGLQCGTIQAFKVMAENVMELQIEQVSKHNLSDIEQWACDTVNNLISQAITEKAADIHISPTDKECFHIHFRINGYLELKESIDIKKLPYLLARIKLLSDLDVSEKRLPQNGRLLIKADHQIDLRIATLPSILGEGVTLRILDQQNFCLDEELIFPEETDRELFRKLLNLPDGHIVFSGPSGSGKTTTLYLALTKLAKKGNRKIISVENPVEMLLDNILQVQINPKIGMTFPLALQTALHHAPDVVSVGEVQNIETIDLISHIVQTGHLVFSQLHAKDSVDVIRLLQNNTTARSMVTPVSVLNAVICQRLIRKICPHCSQLVAIDKLIADKLDLPTSLQVKKAVGCAECINTGYKGRLPVYEIFEVDNQVRELATQQNFDGILQYRTQKNIDTMLKKALKYVQTGQTSIEEIQRLFEY